MKLGIFDSGIGGRAVGELLIRDFPEAEMLIVDDHAHIPYGDREREDIITLTDTAIQPLLVASCDVIILACNTATAAAIETLRARYPTQKFIGLEPMIKPAAQLTQTGIICVCATPATLRSERYQNLKKQYAKNITVIEPDCHNWARMIEDNDIQEAEVKKTITDACEAGADVIVLACTHYHWIRETIEQAAAGRATIIDPSAAISRRVSELLS